MSGRRYTRDGGVKTGARSHGAHSAVVGKDFVQASQREAYRQATAPDTSASRAKGSRKAKAAPKPPKPEAYAGEATVKAIHASAVRVFELLTNLWPSSAMPFLSGSVEEIEAKAIRIRRGVAIHAFFSEIAAAHGMRALPIEVVMPELPSEAAAAIRAEMNRLPLVEITPDQFGAFHERLSDVTATGSLDPKERKKKTSVHFTPRSLTEPIVLRTLEPLLRDRGAVFREARAPKFQTGDPVMHEHDPQGPVDAAAALLANTISAPRPERILSLKVCDPAVGAGVFLLSAARILGAMLVRAWEEHGGAPDVPDKLVAAKQLVAINCLYGIDICPFAIQATKLALTLECRADRLPESWLSNLRHGDALVGLSRDQIARFHWSPDGKGKKGDALPEHPEIARVVDDAMAEGRAAREAWHAEMSARAIGGAT